MVVFFSDDENMVILKKDIITGLRIFAPRFQNFFRHSQRSYKRNNPQKMTLDEYTVDALFFIVSCRSLLRDYTEYNHLMTQVIQSNYSTTSHLFHFQHTHKLLTEFEEIFQTNELFIYLV